MVDINEAARPYAKAAFDVAIAKEQLTSWNDFLQNLSAIITDSQVTALLHNPKITLEQWLDFFLAVLGDEITEQMKNFLHLVISYNRLVLIPKIVTMFGDFMNEYKKIAAVKIVSAYPLTSKQEIKLKEALAKKLNREIKIFNEVDKSILGGAIIRVGNFVIDGSALSRVNQLKQSL